MSQPYFALAGALRDIADRVDDFADANPDLPADSAYFMFQVYPLGVSNRPEDGDGAALVDTFGKAIVGQTGVDGRTGGTHQRKVSANVGPLRVLVLANTPDPAEVDLAAENARLRAELAALRAESAVAS